MNCLVGTSFKKVYGLGSTKMPGLYDIEYDYISTFLNSKFFKVVYIEKIEDIKYVFVFLGFSKSSNINDCFKVIQLPKLRKYYINIPYYDFFYKYTYRVKKGVYIEKYNKVKSLDKNNHFRPIQKGYINSKGYKLVNIEEVRIPSKSTHKKLIGLGY